MIELHIALLTQHKGAWAIRADAHRHFDGLRSACRAADLESLHQAELIFVNPTAKLDEVPLLGCARHRADAEAQQVVARVGFFDLVLRLQPARGLVWRQRDDLLGVDIEDGQISARLGEWIIQVALKAGPVLLENSHAELRLLLIGDAFAEGRRRLGAVAIEIGFRDTMAFLEVAIVSASNHRVRMQLDLAALFDGPSDGLGGTRTRHLDPVNPQRELGSDAVALFRFGEDTMRDLLGLVAAFLLEEKAAPVRR